MNSFTSVFKWPEIRVVMVLVALLTLLECFFRVKGGRLSSDVRNIESIAQVAEEVSAAPTPRWLFVGNSLLQAGVDPVLLRKEMLTYGAPQNLGIFMAYPDSSHMKIWDYLVERYFAETDCLPDKLVLVTGRMHLADAPANVSHLGAYYVSWRALPRYLKEDGGSSEAVAEFFVGRSMALMRSRQRVSPRVFDILLPHYQENWHLLNEAAMQGPLVEKVGQASKAYETRHLRHFIRLLSERKVELLVVKAPMQHSYELPEEILEVLGQAGVPVVDVNPLLQLGAEHFADADHLNEAGRVLFTRALGEALGKGW
ncbi:hypothetical protein WJU23_14210 [Prosthecobacter sp. SYSU 5D2]|uniref:hypothetical protein n=1 Tax=Prosthecobacter sp. SYSU 5D2 TaxID=3134134 RepID=UPI0031FEAD90